MQCLLKLIGIFLLTSLDLDEPLSLEGKSGPETDLIFLFFFAFKERSKWMNCWFYKCTYVLLRFLLLATRIEADLRDFWISTISIFLPATYTAWSPSYSSMMEKLVSTKPLVCWINVHKRAFLLAWQHFEQILSRISAHIRNMTSLAICVIMQSVDRCWPCHSMYNIKQIP